MSREDKQIRGNREDAPFDRLTAQALSEVEGQKRKGFQSVWLDPLYASCGPKDLSALSVSLRD
jgi:hypothetical protein